MSKVQKPVLEHPTAEARQEEELAGAAVGVNGAKVVQTIGIGIKDEITDIIAGHLDLYRPIAESITDEVVVVLARRIPGLLLV